MIVSVEDPGVADVAALLIAHEELKSMHVGKAARGRGTGARGGACLVGRNDRGRPVARCRADQP